jgi:hypothetical protein
MPRRLNGGFLVAGDQAGTGLRRFRVWRRNRLRERNRTYNRLRDRRHNKPDDPSPDVHPRMPCFKAADDSKSYGTVRAARFPFAIG